MALPLQGDNAIQLRAQDTMSRLGHAHSVENDCALSQPHHCGQSSILFGIEAVPALADTMLLTMGLIHTAHSAHLLRSKASYDDTVHDDTNTSGG